MPTIEDQIALEKMMMQGGVDRYHYNKDRMMNKELQSETAHGRSLVYKMLAPLADGVKKMLMNEPPKSQVSVLLRNTDPAQIAYLSLVALINSISLGGRKLSPIAKGIGMRIETQVVIDAWIDKEPEIAKEILKMAMAKSDLGYDNKRAGVIHKMLDMGHEASWTTSKRINVGTRMIDLIVQTLGIIEVNRRHQRKGVRPYFVDLTEGTEAWISKFHEHNEANSPTYLPSIVPPKPWTSAFEGGYHSPYIIQKPLMRVY